MRTVRVCVFETPGHRVVFGVVGSMRRCRTKTTGSTGEN